VVRPGRAGANIAADHVLLLDLALAQLPVTCKGDDAVRGVEMLVRADSAGATHGFVNAIVDRGMEFSIGFDVTMAVRLAILQVPKNRWCEPMGQDMEPRQGAGVAEITRLSRLVGVAGGDPGHLPARTTPPRRPVHHLRARRCWATPETRTNGDREFSRRP
jgi:hypothetical protein